MFPVLDDGQFPALHHPAQCPCRNGQVGRCCIESQQSAGCGLGSLFHFVRVRSSETASFSVNNAAGLFGSRQRQSAKLPTWGNSIQPRSFRNCTSSDCVFVLMLSYSKRNIGIRDRLPSLPVLRRRQLQIGDRLDVIRRDSQLAFLLSGILVLPARDLQPSRNPHS